MRALLPILLTVGSPAYAGPVPAIEGGSVLDHRVHVRIDSDATWGIGGQMFLGAQLHTTGYVGVWNTKRATGSVDFGLNLAYDNEAAFLAPWIDPSEVSGAGHRVQVLASFGGTFHLTPSRRFGLGLHGLAGLSHWVSQYRVVYADEDFEAEGSVARSFAIVGGQLTLSYRASKHVGVNVIAMAPLPLESSYAISFGHIGAGLTFYLR